ncbi:HAUS augmin-like complex subunit 7 isoform X2 [Pungitius pungitius]|uniref:HAUS augmin-like complex subunit 7 isoform X2 n=1 Tax=Pungitius pungitius TaxID=134920 RepID=UPI002E15F031
MSCLVNALYFPPHCTAVMRSRFLRKRETTDLLKAASCPLVEGLYLQEASSMLQLLCAPSQHRTDILKWICSSINPNFGHSKTMVVRSSSPDVLTKEIAALGQELMLCRADDLDLIRGEAGSHRQLRFLEQLLTLVPGCEKSAGDGLDTEVLLNELFTAENLPHLSRMLRPALDPWPADIKALFEGAKSSLKPNGKVASDVIALLQLTRSTLEQLQSQCEFLGGEAQCAGVFSPSSLRVAACDLQLLMATFSHAFESHLRAYCSREPPCFSAKADVFQRTHQLVLAFIKELEMLQKVSEASASLTEEVNHLQTQPSYRRRGERLTLPEQLEELRKRIGDVLPLIPS